MAHGILVSEDTVCLQRGGYKLLHGNLQLGYRCEDLLVVDVNAQASGASVQDRMRFECRAAQAMQPVQG